MNPKAITWILGAIAVSLAAVLAAVILQRPPTGSDIATGGPVSTTPSAPATPAPASPAPTAKETNPAAEGLPRPLPSSEVEAHDASPGSTPYSQTDEARDAWWPVVTGFGKAFTATRGKNAAQWRDRLAPFVTGKVEDQLGTVALGNVPEGTFDRIEPAEYGEDKVAVFVHYDTDLTLVTYLIQEGSSWRIYAYDRWQD